MTTTPLVGPEIEDVVQEDVGKERADGSLNAKDNFAVGERSRSYWRRRAPFHREGGWEGDGVADDDLVVANED
ncbi:hypothetical protein, partial [Bradyrhizobium diazoefficiens]|uniref:hypothetical protein n=1 Tax=Bradyrhizobium diazoefficiens TaxID=1355477 RepID=UPI000577465D